VLFGRIGGEEFAAMLPVGDHGEAFAIADRVRRNFATAAARFAENDLTPTVSVGMTIGLDAKAEVEDLLVIADEALYRAKANGRDRVEASSLAEEAGELRTPSIVPLPDIRIGAAA
jgi:diguanylate cyclase (GGDEF)-like protein